MSSGCSRFKQNAWKKEMCTNCYKTKEEHQERPKPAPLDLPLLPPSQGILKGWDRDRKKKRKSVSFPLEEKEIIGYGGDEGSSEEECEMEVEEADGRTEEDEPDGDEEKQLNRITKTNTDFNSVLFNLLGKPTAPSPQRETVQVTVQPFSNSLATSRKLHFNKLLQDNGPSLTIIPCDKEQAKEPEVRKVNITRGTVLTKNHESVKNKLYIQNIINGKSEKRNSFSMQDTVYVTQEEVKEERVDFLNAKNILNTEICVLNCKKEIPIESREMAGEPDGKADSDGAEVPVTPPPRVSFLHREEGKKSDETKCTKRQAPKPPSESDSEPDSKTDSDGDCCHLEPEPPAEAPPETPAEPTMVALEKAEPLRICLEPAEPPKPVEAEPPQRPHSINIPCVGVTTSDALRISVEPPSPDSSPEPFEPRRCSPKREPPPLPPTTPEPRKSPPEPLPRHKAFMDVEKKKTKMKETIKKLLRFGSKEEMETEIPLPRQRPQIIHPLDLNKSAVQVLPSAQLLKTPSPDHTSPTNPTATPIGRPNKPPPPPRSESLNLMERLKGRPGSENNIYANLGEARSGITPVKPVRTGSMREAAKVTLARDLEDNLYEAIGSAPECDRTSLPYYGSETESDTYSHTLFSRERCRLRRDRVVAVYSTIRENFSALAEINLQTLNFLYKQILDKGKTTGGRYSDYNICNGRKEVGNAVFLEAEKGISEVTLGIIPANYCLFFPPALPPIASFQDTVSSVFNPKDQPINEVAVVERVDAETLSEYKGEEGSLVLLQLLQIMESSKLALFSLENFILLYDKHNHPIVTYLHNKTSSEGEVWKVVLMSACKVCQVEADQLMEATTVEEAVSIVHAMLWGPPATIGLDSLRSWLHLQRAAVLRSLITEPSTITSLQLAFLASSPDLLTLHSHSVLLDSNHS